MDYTPLDTNILRMPKSLRNQQSGGFFSKYIKPVGQGIINMGKQLGGAIGQGVSEGFGVVGKTINQTPGLKQGVGVLNALDYGLGTAAKTTEGLLTKPRETLMNLKYRPGEGLQGYAQRNVTDITPYVTQKVAGTPIGQKIPLLAPMLGLGAGMISPSPSDLMKVGKVAGQAGDLAKFSDDAGDLVSQAKKYKSAEEFVRAQPTAEQIGTKEFGADDFRGGKIKLFHQTGADIKSFDKDIPTFFNTKERYQTYGDKTIEAVADIKKPLNMGTEIWIQTEQPSLIAKAKKRGYDAVTFTHYMDNPNVISEVIVIDPKIIKTKSQLIDIWNKANPATDPLIQEAKKYKTASEFVKRVVFRGEPGQGDIVSKPYGSLIKETKTGLPKTAMGVGGIPVSKDFVTARGFGSEVRAYIPNEDVKILTNPQEIMKMANVKSAHDFYFKAGKVPPVDSVSFYEKAKLAGYDAVDLSAVEKLHRELPGDTVFLKGAEQEMRIINKSAFTEIKNPPKTKSQLIDIWNKAQEK